MTERGVRRRLSPDERREQLLDATLAVAAGGDLSLVSVQEIAARAGVSEGLLYHYYPTKQAIVTAAVTRAAEALMTDLQAVVSEGSPLQQLADGLRAYLRHVRTQPTGWRALLAARGGELGEVAASIETRSEALVWHLLGIDEPSPALRVALAGFIGFEREACLVWLDHPEMAIETIEAMLLAVFQAVFVAAAEYDDGARVALERLKAS